MESIQYPPKSGFPDVQTSFTKVQVVSVPLQSHSRSYELGKQLAIPIFLIVICAALLILLRRKRKR